MRAEASGRWDVDTNDWKVPRGLVDTQKCYPSRGSWKGLYARKGRPLDIFMHVNPATANDLKDFIHGLQAEGWEFRAYGDPPQRPSVAIA
jgi:hypothetical protein